MPDEAGNLRGSPRSHLSDVDLLVVGGGVNGCAIARDAAGRGLQVLLVEQDDLAAWTSSASSKLIHGGLRYLEQYAFRLVREALQERERLLATAPHIIHPLRFVLPHGEGHRPAWMLRLGLFIYDHLGGRRTLPATRSLHLDAAPEGEPLKPKNRLGFAYWDCAVDDSRLVVLNAVDAAGHGAEVLTRTRLLRARRENGGWLAELESRDGGARSVRARALVNAAGPWVSEVLAARLGVTEADRLRLVKGSHIVVPRLYEGEHAYILQNPDGRIVFVIPWVNDLSLIGTTDEPFEGDLRAAAISEAEIAYLCEAVSAWFRKPITPRDIVSTFAGVRPLYDDAAASASAVTRDYVLALDAADAGAPVISAFGGKITTSRRLAEHVMDKLTPWFPQAQAPWTSTAPFPGGDIPDVGALGAVEAFRKFLATQAQRYPFLAQPTLERMARAYGTRMDMVLGAAGCLADLGENFGADLTRAEVDYLVAHEWAREADDILMRRSRLGLVISKEGRVRLARCLDKAASHEKREASHG